MGPSYIIRVWTFNIVLPLLPRAAGQGVGLTQSDPRPAVLAVPCSPRRAFTHTLTPPGAQAPTV
eukprot:5092604-Prymnesium_polylepis.1